MTPEAAETSLAQAFGAAAIDPTAWTPALQLLAKLTGSSHGQLIGIGGAEFIPFNWVSDLPPNATDDFVAIKGGDPTICYRVAAHGRAPIVGEDDYDAVKPTLASDVYLDFCSHYDIPYGVQADLLAEDGGLIGFALLRSERNGRTPVEARRLFARAIPHALNAVRTQLALDGQAGELAAGTLEALGDPFILLDARGQARAVTRAAEGLLARSEALRIVRGALVAPRASDRMAIAKALAAAMAERDDRATCRQVIVRGKAPHDMLLLEFLTLPIPEWSLRFRPRVVIRMRCAGAATIKAELLRELFGLTPSEADIVAALAAGTSRSAIAVARGAALTTITTQIKSIFAKSGVSREGELIALVRDLLG